MIIKDIKELDFLEKRLKSDPMLMKKNVIYKLLYRATKDGNSPNHFIKNVIILKELWLLLKLQKEWDLEDILNVLGILTVEIQ